MAISNCSSGHSSVFKVVLLESTQMQQLPVSTLMRVCPTAVVSESTQLREAAEILVTSNSPVLIVTNSAGKMLGVVTENAVIRQLMSTPCRKQSISKIISRHVESVRKDTDLNSILHLFRSACHGIVPVVDSGDSVVGFLYRRDVVSYLLSDGEAFKQTETAQKSDKDRVSKPHFMNRNVKRSDLTDLPPRSPE